MQQIKLSEKALLNIKEVMAYTGWGENSVRSLLNDTKCRFVVRKGKRLFANRKLLDKYIDSISGM